MLDARVLGGALLVSALIQGCDSQPKKVSVPRPHSSVQGGNVDQADAREGGAGLPGSTGANDAIDAGAGDADAGLGATDAGAQGDGAGDEAGDGDDGAADEGATDAGIDAGTDGTDGTDATGDDGSTGPIPAVGYTEPVFAPCTVPVVDYGSASFYSTGVPASGLVGAKFSASGHYSSVLWSDADLTCADFGSAEMSGTFDRSTFARVTLVNTWFYTPSLAGIQVSFAHMYAHATSATLTGAVFEDSIIDHTDFNSASAAQIAFHNVSAWGVGLGSADLQQAVFERVYAHGAHFEQADLTGARFEGVDLSSAYMDGAVLTGATFRDTSLAGAGFRGADLRQASFGRIDFTGTDLRDAHLEGTGLTREALLQAGALVDGATF